MDVIESITQRASTRAFLDEPVAPETVDAILDAARWAPSGANTQPWRVAVVSGSTQRSIGDAIIEARDAGLQENPDYTYYPGEWFEPYKSRRLDCGLALYGALGIRREDKERRKAAWYDNYRFFGAPVGLLFFLERQLSKGSWVDMGMFIQNVMLAAMAHQLATCPQASLAEYPDIVRDILGVPDSLALVCGMALGYPDRSAPVNNYRTTREPVSAFTSWYK
jgi:nitroreductase